MILSAQTIWALCNPPAGSGVEPLISPAHERTREHGMTFGVGPAGYDVRIKQALTLAPRTFALASTVEWFAMPANVIATVMDKSTWARRGLSLFNTVIEPGWSGWLTIELTNQSDADIAIPAGAPIAQIMFQWIDQTTAIPYRGKYHNQADEPVAAILEGSAPS